MLLCFQAYADILIDNENIGVIIPEVRKPYKIIFDDINKGVVDALSKTPKLFYINANTKHSDIHTWVIESQINSVITLGQASTKLMQDIPSQVNIVSGALLTMPTQSKFNQGVALTPNPKDLFYTLKMLKKKNKRVAVVYNPDKYQWLIDLAKSQVSAYGIELLAYKATNIKESVKIYTRLLSNDDNESLALWLLQDRSTVDNKVVLPFLLEKAWQKSMVIFSSSLGHVKKGALFCMYPNNRAHGRQLGKLLIDNIRGRNTPSTRLTPTHEALTAINARTAEHLGNKLSNSDLKDFDVVFPMPN
jgi:putative ABC transport system substrate-binding protein